jgi:flagellar hook protein FlgE
MSFNTALSGLNAAANNLAVTGNNIANANTTGFKRSRSEFADVYASSFGDVSSTTSGSGVRVANVAQQFTPGNLEFTDNSLDLAVSGEGLFVLGGNVGDVNSKVYTRAGAFHLDEDGYVVNNDGKALLTYKPNGTTVDEGFSTGVLQTLRVDSAQGLPKATSKVDIKVNLDARATPPATALFSPNDPTSFTKSSSLTIYDSLGNPYDATTYFVADNAVTPNQWQVYTALNGQIVKNTPDTLVFDTTGALQSPASGQVSYPPFNLSAINPASKAAPLSLSFNYSGSTQFGTAFSVDQQAQDGLTVGRLNGVDIDKTGVVFARYSNGASKPLGQVALAKFPNPQGLSKLGDTNWAESADSGLPISGSAGTANFGTIESGALEESNVDLAAQLVNLIVAQQSYQANAQTISTENSIAQTILNIR